MYQLTPLGPDWGWGLRLAEIAGQTLGYIVVRPLVAVHNGIGWLLSKVTA